MKRIIKEFDYSIYIPANIEGYVQGKKMAFFDIETTGLDSRSNSTVLIGVGYEKDGKYVVEQYFAESLGEEREVLLAFKEKLQEFNTVVTYNGKSFDVPFINSRLVKHNIDYLLNHENFDLLPHIRASKEKLGLYSCSLKNVEKFLRIKREDKIDGGESVNLYFEYLESRDEIILEKILKHNFEDVFNLPEVLRIFENISLCFDKDKITDKQKSFLNSLLRKNKYELTRELDMLTKQEASKLIDYLLNGGECQYKDYIEKKGD